MKSITVFIHKCDIHGKLLHTLHQLKITNSQPLIIQDTFLGIPVTGNSIQQPVTYVYFSHFIVNKPHSTNNTIMLQGSDSHSLLLCTVTTGIVAWSCTCTVSSTMIMMQKEMPLGTKQIALYSLQY